MSQGLVILILQTFVGKLKENCGAVDKAEVMGAGQTTHQHIAFSLGKFSIQVLLSTCNLNEESKLKKTYVYFLVYHLSKGLSTPSPLWEPSRYSKDFISGSYNYNFACLILIGLKGLHNRVHVSVFLSREKNMVELNYIRVLRIKSELYKQNAYNIAIKIYNLLLFPFFRSSIHGEHSCLLLSNGSVVMNIMLDSWVQTTWLGFYFLSFLVVFNLSKSALLNLEEVTLK